MERNTTIWIDRETWERVKIAATKRRITIKRLIQLAVQDYLSRNGDGQGEKEKGKGRGRSDLGQAEVRRTLLDAFPPPIVVGRELLTIT